ncbi:helix-turn-helix transcriptional regulator [Solibacillus sp. CAU 1738]|uniref:helix-turn-helix domain-containing protein n=1 Tax=Solibacillus sp. CAU 1738 TaxID=3140363 RepID=UPI0032605950
MNYIQAGQLIRSLRKEKNISMNELAQKLEVSQASISRIEGGIQEFNFTMLTKITEQFDISLSEFFLRLEGKVDTKIKIKSTKQKSGNIDTELIKLINDLSEEQKKGLYVLLLPYIKS